MGEVSIDKILLILLAVLAVFVVLKALVLPKSFEENQEKRDEIRRKSAEMEKKLKAAMNESSQESENLSEPQE